MMLGRCYPAHSEGCSLHWGKPLLRRMCSIWSMILISQINLCVWLRGAEKNLEYTQAFYHSENILKYFDLGLLLEGKILNRFQITLSSLYKNLAIA